MFTRSTLSTLATIVLLACGSHAGAEAFDPSIAASGWTMRPSRSLSSSHALRSDLTLLRNAGHDAIEPWQPVSSASRMQSAPAWHDNSASDATRAVRRLNFNRTPDDERAGSSSASISLGRLNLNEPRAAAFGSVPQTDLDRELAQLRDNVNRVRVVPQVSLGMRVKF